MGLNFQFYEFSIQLERLIINGENRRKLFASSDQVNHTVIIFVKNKISFKNPVHISIQPVRY
jgi:hypothetical protein